MLFFGQIEGHYGQFIHGDGEAAAVGASVIVGKGVGDQVLAGTLSATTNTDGVATFADLEIHTVGTYSLVFSTDGLADATSDDFDVIAGAAQTLGVQTQPDETTAGEAIAGPPAALVVDQHNNPVGSVTVTVAVSGHNFDAGTTTFQTDTDGIATFSDLVIEAVGTYSLIFSSDGLADAISDDFDVTSDDANELVIEEDPTNTIAGESIEGPPSVKVVDQFDNPVGGVTVTVAVSGHAFDAGITSLQTGTDGIAAFDDLVIETAGTYSLVFISSGMSDVTSASFAITHAALAGFRVTFANNDKLAVNPPFLLSQPSQPDPPALIAQHQIAASSFEAEQLWVNPLQLANPHHNGNNRPYHQQYNQIGPQVAGADFDITISAVDPFANIVLSYTGSVELSTNNEFGVGVVTTTAALSSGVLIIHTVSLRVATQSATITATGGGESGTSDPFDVLPKPIDITVDDATRIYGDPDPSFSFQDFSSELIAGDVIEDITGGTGLASDVFYVTDTDGESAVGVYPGDIGIVSSSLDGSRADNYIITIIKGELEITRRNLLLTNFTAGDKTYDGTTDVLSGDGFDDDRLFTDDLLFSYDVAFDDPNVGVGIDVFFSNIELIGGADVGNYSLTVTAGTTTATISRRELTITADDQYKEEDGDPFPVSDYTVSYDGFAPGEGPGVLSGTLEFTGTAIAATEVGEYVITPGGLGSTNYNITYVDGQLAIGRSVPLAKWAMLVLILLMVTFSAFRFFK